MPLVNGPIDWDGIDLVVFDIDGTLYDQRLLRARMLYEITREAWRSRSLDLPIALFHFRRFREILAGELTEDFRRRQYVLTAERVRRPVEEIEALVEEWMERRPLPFLAACRYPHLIELFAALATQGKQVAALSDYPASDKLAALGLRADWIVSAVDEDVGWMKPHPAGLSKLIAKARVGADRVLMVGDRFDRDWEAARRAGVRALIRSGRRHPQVDTFISYAGEPFGALVRGAIRDPRCLGASG